MFMRMFRDIFCNEPPSLEKREDVDVELKRLRDSLDQKRKIAIEKMGDKWVLHPAHHVKKQDVAANSLGFRTA
jgi:hypothetical protein